MENPPEGIAQWPLWIQILFFAFVSIGSFQTLYHILRWKMHRIWPGREKWNAECLPPTPEEPNRDSPRVNPRVAFDKSLGLGRWSQMRQMEVHDYYRLDIGKPRILKRIKFKTETKNDLRYPKRYILEVS
jgi:hypothetical protein